MQGPFYNLYRTNSKHNPPSFFADSKSQCFSYTCNRGNAVHAIVSLSARDAVGIARPPIVVVRRRVETLSINRTYAICRKSATFIVSAGEEVEEEEEGALTLAPWVASSGLSKEMVERGMTSQIMLECTSLACYFLHTDIQWALFLKILKP